MEKPGKPAGTQRDEEARALGARLLGHARAWRAARERDEPEELAAGLAAEEDSESLYRALREFARAELERAGALEESIEEQLDRSLRTLRQRRRALAVIESSLEALLEARPVTMADGSTATPDPDLAGPDWAFLAGAAPGSEAEVERLRYRMAWLEARSEELETQCRSVLEQSGLDARTGLLSEQAFWGRVDEETRRACRSGQPVSAAAFGGDVWARHAANAESEALSRSLSRAGRIARRELHRPGDSVGRSGAGLLLLLPNTGRTGARLVAGRIQRALEAHRDVAGGAWVLTCRGGTIWPRKGGTAARLRQLVLGEAAPSEASAASPSPAAG